ncbi:hypothetical protein [Rhizobium johnstonii]|uniref:hypothetical protein n=1 Tax=Rhizobium johnstonii TaxID=3019933 RepID=UPI003F9D88ED
MVVRLPTKDEARQLKQRSEAQPILLTNKVDVDMKGTPITYSETVWARRADRVHNTSQVLNSLAEQIPCNRT